MTRFRLILLVAVAALILVAPASPRASLRASLPTVLGHVGPGATISLKDHSGKPVQTLKPGKYKFLITDRSKSDDFHLVGPTVNLKTPIKLTTQSGWVLTMKPGTYRFYSDAHPKTLKGSFKVS